LEELIDKVESIGLNVVGLVSDIGSNFQKLVKEMAITPEKPWFIHKGKNLYYISDPPHIIKAVRNNLMKYDYHFENKVASWRDITAIYEIDSKNSIRCCPKLTNTHISPNGFQRMKVKLATQVMSHTVSAAMLMAVSGGLLPPSAAGTAELVANFDKIFYSLNSTSFKSHKPHNRPITAESDHCQFMNEMRTFVKGITVINPTTGKDVTSQLKCLKALKMTLNATILLWNSLKSSIKFLVLVVLIKTHWKMFSDASGNKAETVTHRHLYSLQEHSESFFSTTSSLHQMEIALQISIRCLLAIQHWIWETKPNFRVWSKVNLKD
jgi:hypothetical protein